ncbi:MAG: class I SAM-dependent methyltransferase [Myxococcota bacterium]
MEERLPPAPLAERLVRELREQHGPELSRVRLLELGCGEGHDARYFYESGILVQVCDQEHARIATLNRIGIPGQTFDLRLTWPLVEASFEVIYSHFVLSCDFQHEHIEHIFRELRRIISPGGKIYLAVRSIEDPTARKFFRQGPGYFSLGDTGLYFFSVKKLRAYAQGWTLHSLAHTFYTRAGEAYGVLELVAQNAPSIDMST